MAIPIKVRKSKNLQEFESNFAETMAEMEVYPDQIDAFMTNPAGNPVTPGNAVISAGDWATKMITRAQAAGADWLAGVTNPSRDPVQAAIKANAKYKAQMSASIAQDKWVKAMAKVDSSTIVAVATAIGAQGYANGIAARTAKINAVVADLQPRVAALKASILNMPDVTDADREARMLAAKRGMQTIGKVRRGL